MDSNLFYILIATGVISLLTLVYVVVDENLKQRRYAKEVAERKEREQEELANNPPVEVSEAVAETEPTESAPVDSTPEPQSEESGNQEVTEEVAKTEQDEVEQPPV
ncbi:MAG: hypothetical protein HC818_05630 [Synechococcaceae cyanobacterium RM1_1_27]|nr:hypothetical protein [Synechococcaceae cyanobacterium SM2_3_2]NJO86104.1 hypothetical protein [Synechococcaceae cyanobacterium RM1_1_27]